eukprot:15332507-Ditylum_brightwellii.AAC.1
MDGIHTVMMDTEEKLTKTISEDTSEPSPQEMIGQTMLITPSIISATMLSIGTLTISTISLIDEDQNGISTICDEAPLDGKVRQPRPPLLRRCIHVGSWANVYRFDDPTNACGGNTGAIVVKAVSDQYPDDSKIERLRKEREISSQLSTRCSAVRAPLGNACGVEMITDHQGGILNNPRLICFEWTPGITLKEWIKSQQNHLNLSAATETSDNDDIEGKNRRSLMPFIFMACHISKALAEIHEVGGV